MNQNILKYLAIVSGVVFISVLCMYIIRTYSLKYTYEYSYTENKNHTLSTNIDADCDIQSAVKYRGYAIDVSATITMRCLCTLNIDDNITSKQFEETTYVESRTDSSDAPTVNNQDCENMCNARCNEWFESEKAKITK